MVKALSASPVGPCTRQCDDSVDSIARLQPLLKRRPESRGSVFMRGQPMKFHFWNDIPKQKWCQSPCACVREAHASPDRLVSAHARWENGAGVSMRGVRMTRLADSGWPKASFRHDVQPVIKSGNSVFCWDGGQALRLVLSRPMAKLSSTIRMMEKKNRRRAHCRSLSVRGPCRAIQSQYSPPHNAVSR